MKFKNGVQAVVVFTMVLALAGAGINPSWAVAPAEPALASQASNSGLEEDLIVEGPFAGTVVEPYVFNGDLRDLPQISSGADLIPQDIPLQPIPGQKEPAAPAYSVDSVAQSWQGEGQMPDPIISFEGVMGSEAGGYAPPDTNGDVGLTHYVQTVNVGIGMYDKATGTELVNIRFNDFFTGTGTLCDYSNRGDPVSLYDPMAGRWLITDFGWVGSSAPYFECIAISQSEDPVSGGWYFYALVIVNPHALNDYPRFGVWPDAYYMSANMFSGDSGARVWALERAAMLVGDPMRSVSFRLGSSYWSLLPANLRGTLPPAGAPNYYASVVYPNLFRIWEFHVDWVNLGNSTFTGPTTLTVADFEISPDIPQLNTTQLLDSLTPRLMMQLQYRNLSDHEALWVNHTVGNQGIAGVRWYEVRGPGGTPYLYQQGTFQVDDGHHRWMGSLAVDQDGNMAVGYSVSSENMYPSIRYAGRLADEPLGTLPQAETSLIEGTGAQLGVNRWGDYSAMSVDPVDDCTFWYTTEYYETSSSRNWQTRIGSFRFPSCGQPKGWITGEVYDFYTMAPIPGVSVVGESPTTTLTVETDASGRYTMTLPGDDYTLTAGPFLPGYPDPTVVTGVVVTAGLTTVQDIALLPQPNLVEGMVWVDDDVPGGNDNGYPEPGESGLLLWESIENSGAVTATNVTAHLIARTPGVTVTIANAAYPDIGVGETMSNLTPFELTFASTALCGGGLDFDKEITTDQGVYTIPLRLYLGIPQPLAPLFGDDMESGSGNWSTGGTNNHWSITEEEAHSPTHAWSDSPGGDYSDNTNAWLQSPLFDLSDKVGIELGFWHRYALESGYDFGYLEYSLNGGTDWELWDSYNGFQTAWTEEHLVASHLDEEADAAFRYRLFSDGGVTDDGWYIDDVELYYQPFLCLYPALGPAMPVLVSPPDGTITTTHQLTLTWEAGVGEIVDGYNLDVDGTVITTTGTSLMTSLSAGVHAWTVRAYNSAGYPEWAGPWPSEVQDMRIFLPLVVQDGS